MTGGGDHRKLIALLTTLLLSPPSLAGVPATLPGVFNGPPPSHGHDFVTITHAGNRAALESERLWGVGVSGVPDLGAVNYEFRMARTEVTVSQWLNFVNAYWPHWEAQGGTRIDSSFTSIHIVPTSFGSGTNPGFIIPPGRENYPATMSWNLAAIYCNYLHNGAPAAVAGQVIPLSVFTSGAYDVSTFTRSEGALFWIPSLNEWTKAVYYDPNRYGQGQDGYWPYPYANITPPTSGMPGDPNAQTDAGGGASPESYHAVGAYPNASSPWGLLDASGSVREMTETFSPLSPAFGRLVRGSRRHSTTINDIIDNLFESTGPTIGGDGLRIASAVPTPGGALILIAAAFGSAGRRRRMSSLAPSPSANPSPLAGEGSVAQQRRVRGFALLASALLLSSPSLAATPATLPGVFNGPPPSYGHDFVTIGAPGNRAALESERLWGVGVSGVPDLGAVNYEFRMARTEVTVSQWLNFVNAYWPHWEAQGGTRIDSSFTSIHIVPTSFGPGTNPGFIIPPGRENYPATMSWNLAAIYCNYLHNGAPVAVAGQVIPLSVFTSGAYDVSTFTRSEGALFWIPSLNEWTKAVYYDPNRYGQGQDGYWPYPYANITPPTSGMPGDPNAQTDAGGGASPESYHAVGAYPNASSPWGLLDASGSVREMTETFHPFDPALGRLVRGSRRHGTTINDIIDNLFGGTSPTIGGDGLRIASAIPTPGGALVLIAAAFVSAGRRRRMSSLAPSPSANPSPLAGEGSVAQQRRVRGFALLTSTLLLSSPALARPAPPNYWHDFVTIGAPGNRAALESERLWGVGVSGVPDLGAVNYEFRMARTEVTVSQWLNFVNAYWPHWEAQGNARFDSSFTSIHIVPTSFGPGTNPGFIIPPGRENYPATMSWNLAAIYCNYLHNGAPVAVAGQVIPLSVFTSGAYDVSTFTRSEGALFWIPSLNEWTKAVYYDPNRYGQGQDGYWPYPYANITPPTSGMPGDPNAQTDAGGGASPESYHAVGAYPNAASPWGLLDASGSVQEMTETFHPFDPALGRLVRGSQRHGTTINDIIDNLFGGTGPTIGGFGLRIGSAVPAPGAAVVLLTAAFTGSRRRRRMT